jgi:peptidoglycan/LPS O-acetylase OafA/YrhL
MTSTRMVLGHYWSLMVEEHFYLGFASLFPLLLNRRLLLPVCVLGIVAVFFGRPYVDDPGGHLTQTRVDSFFAGIMIAWMMHGTEMRPVGEILRWMLGSTALALIFIIAILFGQPVPEGFTLLLLASSGVVAIGAINQDVILPVPYLRGAMVWIGERSYSIYLSNSLVAYADYWLRGHVAPFRDSPTALRLALSIGFILLLGDLSYRVFERGGERGGAVLRQLIARLSSSREAVAT